MHINHSKEKRLVLKLFYGVDIKHLISSSDFLWITCCILPQLIGLLWRGCVDRNQRMSRLSKMREEAAHRKWVCGGFNRLFFLG